MDMDMDTGSVWISTGSGGGGPLLKPDELEPSVRSHLPRVALPYAVLRTLPWLVWSWRPETAIISVISIRPSLARDGEDATVTVLQKTQNTRDRDRDRHSCGCSVLQSRSV